MKNTSVAHPYRRSLRFLLLITLCCAIAAPVQADDDDDDDDDEQVAWQLGKDRFVTGDEVRQSGDIRGDLIATGADLTLNVLVQGDLVVAGGEIEIEGEGAQDLYAAGGTINVDGRIGGNARIAGGQIRIRRDSSIDGGASLAGGKVRMDGRIGKYLQLAGGNLRIDGTVEGDVVATGGGLVLGPQANILGTLTFRGPDAPRLEPGAQVRGGVNHVRRKHRYADEIAEAFGWAALAWLVGWLIAGAVLVALWPGFSKRVSESVAGRPWISLLLGLVVLVVTPVLIALLAVSIVGIPLAMLALFVYLLLLPLGYLATALTIGEWGLARLRKGAEVATRHRILALITALVVLFLLTRIPWLGGLIACVVLLIGIGGLLLAAVQKHRASPAPAGA